MPFKIKAAAVADVEPKRFRPGGRLFRLVRLYLESEQGPSLADVRSVEYELHPTFKQRYRLSEDAAREFEIRIWTYGYFKARAKVMLQTGQEDVAEGFVRWDPA
jgi:hypothetical protein